MAYEQPTHYTDPGTQVNRDNGYFEAQTSKQRPKSQSYARDDSAMPERSHVAPPQKVDEAVTSAFDRAGKETQNYVPPELIAQITQNVIKQLQSGGLDASTPIPSQNRFSPPPPPIQQPVPLSPSTASGTSTSMPNRPVYTPPSPQKHQDYPNYSSPESTTRFTMPEGPPSPTLPKTAQFSPPRRSSSPQSQMSEPVEKPTRPKGPSRLSTSKEETTLERIWGQLFDEEGHPTARLGQLLRGLAVHIIEDYEPHHSIVITPTKMQKYYEEVKLANERYPWSTVFDDERSSISRMYRDLSCQHHLVQEKYDERPDIPGLTPVGFERWVTLLIKAHPEEEFERLQKAVLEMPISNPDDKKERFPKEISRRLFPGHADEATRDRIEDSISEHAAVDLPRRSSRDEPRTHQGSPPQKSTPTMDQTSPPQNQRASVSFSLPSTTTASDTTYNPSNLERERKPYSNIPSECAVDDTNPPMPPPSTNPIERERKPYSAMPGVGKQYEDENRAKDFPKPRSESNAPKPSRSDSTARARPVIVGQSRPVEVPKAEVHNHHRAPSNAGRRHRSPSFSRGSTQDFRRSEGDVRGYTPSAYVPPSSGPVGGAPEAIYDESDTRRHFEKNARERAERARRQAEEEARIYCESPRRHDRGSFEDRPPPRRNEYQNDEDYYRAGGRGGGNGYDYAQPYGGPVYR